jgi:hypothetical protein
LIVKKKTKQENYSKSNWNDNTKLVDQIDGFIIAQLGECKRKPNVWSVALICSKGKVGKLMLGAFMFCIKNHYSSSNTEGILELASGYLNLPGFLSYTQMGFIKDFSKLILIMKMISKV